MNWLRKNPFNSSVADVDKNGWIGEESFHFLLSSHYCQLGPKSYFLLFIFTFQRSDIVLAFGVYVTGRGLFF